MSCCSHSPVPARLTAGTDSLYRWVLEPRSHIGVTANLEGKTNKGYAGLTWTAMLARDVIRAGDGIRLDLPVRAGHRRRQA